MFSTKQSDIFYNDETKEMFVCKVSAISARRCEDNSTVYGALPLIYKINKADNYKTLVYPKNLDTFITDPDSDIFNLTPTCAISGTNFNSITKPLVSYNKSTSRYSVTFLGRYITDGEGLGLNNYIFQDINSDFYLLDANIYIPKDKDVTADVFTFESGYLNSDLYVVGNTIRNGNPSWFNPTNTVIERSTDYQIAPMHVQATSSLGFNLMLCDSHAVSSEGHEPEDPITGNIAFPFMYSGGFITYNPKYVAYDPEHTIRVDFTARSFNVPSPTAYGSTQSSGTEVSRWAQQWTEATSPTHGGPGEGFCVSFFKNPPVSSYVIPNGIGSTLGYAKAGFSTNEVVGTAHATDGLYVHNNWHPNTGIGSTASKGYLGPADSFLGIGFDIGGNFATTSEEKDTWYDGNSTWTATPCSIGIRGSKYHNTKVLTAFAMNTVAASAVPMHTSAANAEFVDYRIDLSNKGTKVTLYNKLTSATDYNTITEFRFNKLGGTGAGNDYTPWEGIRSAEEIKNKEWPLLNVGLSFTTSDKVSRFELHKFEVTGVKVNNPWLEKKVKPVEVTAAPMRKIDYLQQSSKNLRKGLINVESAGPVDIDMVVKSSSAKTKPQITLCDGSNPEVIEEDVNVRVTGISPEDVDTAIRVGEQPGPNIITGGPELNIGTGGTDTFNLRPHVPESEIFQCPAQLEFAGSQMWGSYKAKVGGKGRALELKFGLGSMKGVVAFAFDPWNQPDRMQVFAPGVPTYDVDGRPTNLVIDTGFHGSYAPGSYPAALARGTVHSITGDPWPDPPAGVTPADWMSAIIRDATGGLNHPLHYGFNKSWESQVATIRVWAPESQTLWNMLMYCPDAGPVDAQDVLIGNMVDGVSVDFPGWIGSETLSDAEKKRGLIGKPVYAPGSYENVGKAWPNKDKYREYTTGAGMFAQGGYPLDEFGVPIDPKEVPENHPLHMNP